MDWNHGLLFLLSQRIDFCEMLCMSLPEQSKYNLDWYLHSWRLISVTVLDISCETNKLHGMFLMTKIILF